MLGKMIERREVKEVDGATRGWCEDAKR